MLKRLCVATGLPLLHQLLNNPLTLKVAKPDGTTVLATCVLAFDPFAEGKDELSASLKLIAADAQSALAPDAALSVKVRPRWVASA